MTKTKQKTTQGFRHEVPPDVRKLRQMWIAAVAGKDAAPEFSPCPFGCRLDGTEKTCWCCLQSWHTQCEIRFMASVTEGQTRSDLRSVHRRAEWPVVLRDVHDNLCKACQFLVSNGGIALGNSQPV